MSQMTLRQLQLFRDIAQQRSVSRGALANGISQSAASQFLLEAEKEIGLPLLDRRTRPLGLTEAGRLYLEMCRDVLRRREVGAGAVRFATEIVDDHLRTMVREHECVLAPDAATGTGHDRDAALTQSCHPHRHRHLPFGR